MDNCRKNYLTIGEAHLEKMSKKWSSLFSTLLNYSNRRTIHPPSVYEIAVAANFSPLWVRLGKSTPNRQTSLDGCSPKEGGSSTDWVVNRIRTSIFQRGGILYLKLSDPFWKPRALLPEYTDPHRNLHGLFLLGEGIRPHI